MTEKSCLSVWKAEVQAPGRILRLYGNELGRISIYGMHNMKFWPTSERTGQIILITKGNDMKKGMRIAAAVMAAAFSMTVLAGCGKSENATPEGLEIGRAQAVQAEAAGVPCHTVKDSGDDGSGSRFSGKQQRGRDSGCF